MTSGSSRAAMLEARVALPEQSTVETWSLSVAAVYEGILELPVSESALAHSPSWRWISCKILAAAHAHELVLPVMGQQQSHT